MFLSSLALLSLVTLNPDWRTNLVVIISTMFLALHSIIMHHTYSCGPTDHDGGDDNEGGVGMMIIETVMTMRVQNMIMKPTAIMTMVMTVPAMMMMMMLLLKMMMTMMRLNRNMVQPPNMDMLTVTAMTVIVMNMMKMTMVMIMMALVLANVMVMAAMSVSMFCIVLLCPCLPNHANKNPLFLQNHH